jgi:mRNA-degrading endonuclease RelE of RelBE toxin-antitoxin system
LRYDIIFAPEAEEDMAELSARDRTKALDVIEHHLRYEPTKTSKSRIKRLEGMKRPQYRLRIDELRAFYDVIYIIEPRKGVVEILAVKEKQAAMKWLAKFGEESDETSATE